MARWGLLLHPALLGAVLVLGLNDHVFKGVGPSALTGKLSDFSGVFLVTLLACVFVPRPWIAAAAVGILFTALKAVPEAGAVAAPFLGGVTLWDPTDLVALVALWPAVVVAGSVPPSAAPRWTRRALAVLSLLVCTMTITATSCDDPAPYRVLTVGDQVLYARGSGSVPAAVSFDGGRTWRDDVPAAPRVPSLTGPPAEEACTDDGHCFRVGHGTAVEERPPGGTWSPTFEITETQTRNALLNHEGLDVPNPLTALSACRDAGTIFTDAFSSVTVVRVDGVDHAVVAMGPQGVLHKEVGGDWERRPVARFRPISFDEPPWLTALKASSGGTTLGSAALLALWFRRRSRRASARWAGASMMLAIVAILLTMPIFLAGVGFAQLVFVPAMALAAAGVYALLSSRRISDPELDHARRERARARSRRKAR